MIEVGEKAPIFQEKAFFPKDSQIKQLNSKNLRGKWLILTFHPGDFTFVCATDLEGFAEKYEDFKKENAEVLAVSTDTVFSHKVWYETSERVNKIQYPMVEDIKKNVSRAFGFLGDDGMTQRGTVIIDPDGVVQYISSLNNRLGKDINHIYNAFKGLKHIYENPGTSDKFDAIPACWEEGDEPLHINVPEDVGEY